MSCLFRVACIAMRCSILLCLVFTLHYCYFCFLHNFALFCFPWVGSAQHCMSIACNSDFDVCFTYWSDEQAKSESHPLQAHPCFAVQARGGTLCRVCIYGAPGNSLTAFPEASGPFMGLRHINLQSMVIACKVGCPSTMTNVCKRSTRTFFSIVWCTRRLRGH